MFDLDKWQEIFDAIRHNKVRTFATAFGVFWGILMLILLLGAGEGLQNGVRSSMLLDATNSIWVIPTRTSMSYQGMPAGRNYTLNEEDLEAVDDQIHGVEFLSPENWLSGDYLIKYRNNASRYTVYGASSDYFNIKVSQKTTNGRSLNKLDDKEKRKVCIIGSRVAESLFPEGIDPVGEYVTVRGLSFRVVGVFSFNSNAGMDQAQRVYIPFSTFQQSFNPDREVNIFVVTTEEGTSGVDLENRVTKLMKQRHTIHPDDSRAFFVHNQEEEHKKVTELFTGIELFIWLVGIGTLMAGIVGVSNIMIIVVKERTREIGVRKAVGATPWSIVGLIMQESVFITAVAGYFGLFLGVLLLEGVNRLMVSMGAELDFFQRPEVNFQVAITSLVILVFAGAIAGFFPAMKAAQVKPVEALKSD